MSKVKAVISIDEEGNYSIAGASILSDQDMIDAQNVNDPKRKIFLLEIDIRPITVKTVNNIPSKIGCSIYSTDKS